MAAIFCAALVKPCEWLADCCTATCNGMAQCFGSMCSCCGDLCASLAQCCSRVCGALSECCASVCDRLSSLFSKPFSGLVFLAVLMSVAPFGALIYFLADGWGADGCAHPLDTWLLVTLILFVLNLLFALYLSRRLSKEHFDEEDRAAGFNPADPSELNEYRRARSFFLYDPWVCVYICVWMFELAWGIVGVTWVDNSPDCRSEQLRRSSLAAAIVLLVFVCIFLLGCFCSLYSGFLTVCLRDCSTLKCCFCYIYYPFMYSHRKAKERQMKRQGLAAQHAQQQQRPLQGADRNQQQQQQQQQQAQLRHGQAPPQQYGMGSPIAQPNMGGNVYHQPARLNNQAAQQQQQPAVRPLIVGAPAPVYSPPVSYAAPQQFHPQPQASAPYQQQMPQAYQPQAPYQPPPQFSPIGPVYAQLPAQPQPQPLPAHSSYQQSPPPVHSSPAHYQHARPAPAENYSGEGVPYSGSESVAPGGAPFMPAGHVSPPVAQPVAQPVARAQQPQQQPQQSPVARAAGGAKAAAASLKEWLGK